MTSPAAATPRTRQATPDDAPAITAIVNEAIANTTASFWEEPRPISEARDAIAHDPDRYPWIVAVDETAQILGFASSKIMNPRPGYRISAEVSIYIAPHARGRGVGNAIYTDLFARLKSIGYRNIVAGIALPNAASVRLHESMGMQQVGCFKQIGTKFGETLDVGWWQCVLN
ncbi:MAG: N-acetyltransferase family protein [Planctomycetota bacterium]